MPASAESARADSTRTQFPGGDTVPAILVVTRTDGARLAAADVAATDAARARMLTAANVPGDAAQVVVSTDGKAAIATVPLRGDLSGFALNDAVKGLREAASNGLPGELSAEVTGGPAFGADIANSFAGANFTLLAVTATVVALLLIVTYRSPVLWLVPLLVIAFADRVASVLGAAIATAVGTTPDGSTSGITSVLVFGAGTNYALLLISRYREELSHNDDHRAALRTAVRHAGPAIIASNATVVLALLTLLLASSPSTRSLGVQAAAGLVVAAVFVLVVLPPLLALFGKRLFWPFIPSVGAPPLTTTGVWHRVASAVARRPRPDRRRRGAGARAVVHRAPRHVDRVVPDRAVPREGRIGDGIPDPGRTLPQRPDRPDSRRRPDRPGIGTGAAIAATPGVVSSPKPAVPHRV